MIQYMPGPGGAEAFDFTQSDEQIDAVRSALKGDLTVDPAAFQRIAPVHEAEFGDGAFTRIVADMRAKNFPLPPPKHYVSPQTTALCEKLGLTDPLVALIAKYPRPVVEPLASDTVDVGPSESANPEEITLDDSCGEEEAAAGSGSVDDGSGTLYVVEDYIPANGTAEPAMKKLKNGNGWDGEEE